LGWQGLRADEYTEEGPFLVTSEHFADEAIDWARCYHVAPERYALAPEIQLRADDVLLMKDGAAMGKLAYVDSIPGPACLNSHLLLFRPLNGRFANHFLFYILGSPGFKNYMDQKKTGTTFFGISQESIGSFCLALPPLHEQHLILQFLGRETAKIDALIVEQKRLIVLLKEKRQAVISHAVTKGLNPGASMKDSGIEWLRGVPRHWLVKRLKLIAEVQGGVAKGKDVSGLRTIEVPYLRVANVQDGFLDLEDIASIEIAETDLERYLLRPGDVLMNEGGDYDKLGRGHIWRSEIPVCIHQNHVFAVRPKASSPEWLNEVTGAAYAQYYFMTRSKQSTNLASISSTNIMELPVVLPPDAEQKEILTFVKEQRTKIDALIGEAERAISLLQERRTALISATVTGKIDVRGVVTKGAVA
jgi:type I restriction enzyme S subunit